MLGPVDGAAEIRVGCIDLLGCIDGKLEGDGVVPVARRRRFARVSPFSTPEEEEETAMATPER